MTTRTMVVTITMTPTRRCLPFDVIPFIVEHLDRRDLYNAALVSRDFNRVSTAFLYHTLDSRLFHSAKGITVHHPAETLLAKPKLAQYVRCVHENGTVHGAPQCSAQRILPLALSALSLCKNLRSFTWADEQHLPDDIFSAFLKVLKTLPLKELTIRTFGALGEPVWQELHTFDKLERIFLWCMEGPPRVMKDWSVKVKETLTHLELGRCAGVPATLLVFHLSPLQNLTHLRLKGAPSISIPDIVSKLPRLIVLDTDFDPSTLVNAKRRWPHHHYLYSYCDDASAESSTNGSSSSNDDAIVTPAPVFPLLQLLIVRTSSLETEGLRELWPWIRQLAPKPSLQQLTLHSVVVMGEATVQRGFVTWLAEVHSKTLRRIILGSIVVDVMNLRYLCEAMCGMEELICLVESVDARQIKEFTSYASNLQTLRLLTQWYQRVITSSKALEAGGAEGRFTVDDAREVMLRQGSKLRTVAVGKASYRGQWILDEHSRGIRFDVQEVLTQNDRFAI